MGQFSKSGNLAHDTACNTAESTRQGVQATAAQSPSGQATLNAAEIVWARACLASCKTNNGGAGVETYVQLLRALGTGGFIDKAAKLVELPERHKIPTIYPGSFFVRNGGLISYGTNVAESYSQAAARFVGPILRGS